MPWLPLLSFFFGGLFLANATPHLVSGTMGRPFHSPFASPPGRGLSSPIVNVLWGFLNIVVSYLLICRVGDFGWRNASDVGALGLGALMTALFNAWQFGRFHDGDPATRG